MSRRCLVILSMLCLLSPSLTVASACFDIPNRIYSDTKKYAATIQHQALPWKKLSWLIKQLGSPQISKMANEQMEYAWSCESSIGPTLTVTVNAGGQILSVSGQYNLNSGSGIFTQSLVRETPPEQAKTMTPVTTTSSPYINEYNQHFNTAITNQQQLIDDMLARTKNYYANVRMCNPGTYEITAPSTTKMVVLTSIIHGKQNNLCAIDNSYESNGHTTVSRCAFTTESILLFTDQEAESAIKDKVAFDAAHLTPFQQALVKECKVYVDGKPVQ